MREDSTAEMMAVSKVGMMAQMKAVMKAVMRAG